MEKRIHLISGPRNISTALMYSFANRKDCSVVDEPFYAHYLLHNPVEHPGKEETLASLPHSVEEIKNQLIFQALPPNRPFYFIKNMAHHFEGIVNRTFILNLDNLFLIRDPYQLIASFAQVIPNPTLLDIGLKLEWELFEHLKSEGKTALVLDSNRVLSDPEGQIRQLCTALNIPFSGAMLSWEAGARKEDGPWAKYWYNNVHKSTGFVKQKTSSRKLPEHLLPLYEQAKVYYDQLAQFAI